jgi:hypothetical protein
LQSASIDFTLVHGHDPDGSDAGWHADRELNTITGAASIGGARPLRALVTAPAVGLVVAIALSAGGLSRGSVLSTGQVAAFARLPLSFEPNRGQAPAAARFVARGDGYSLLLGGDRLAFTLAGGPGARTGIVLAMRLIGAQPSAVAGVRRLPGVASYFAGSDRSRWRAGIPTFAGVSYHDLWPGIDARFYGNQRRLEYDFDLAAGASSSSIGLSLPGAQLRLGRGGDLLVGVGGRRVRMLAPASYQHVNGRRVAVGSRWVLGPRGRVTITVGAHDLRRPLVIDPVLVYSAFIGGDSGAQPTGIAVDGSGSAYVAGWTTSTDTTFPTTSGAYLRTSSGGPPLSTGMTFVSKLNPEGTALDYSTFIGAPSGFAASLAHAIAVDGAGDAYVTGIGCCGYPTTAGAFQATEPAKHDGSFDVGVVTKLNPSGTQLVYSTYLSGFYGDDPRAIAIDGHGDAYVTGNTTSSGAGGTAPFPTTPGALQTTYQGGTPPVGGGELRGDAFVTELNPAGTGLVYSTFLGGSGDDVANGIALDANGDAYVAGQTTSPGGTGAGAFPTTPGAFQRTDGGGAWDAFVSELDPTGSALVYSTLVGGSGDDEAHAIALEGSDAYVAGYTNSPGGTAVADFPSTPGVLQTANAGGYDAFVTKLDPAGTGLVYSTLLGGSGDDGAFAVAVDGHGDAHVAGATGSPAGSEMQAFPTTADAVQSSFSGPSGPGLGSGDAFVSELDPAGSALLYSSYLGSSSYDYANAIALDSGDNVYVTGDTGGPPGSGVATLFPSTAGGLNAADGSGAGGAAFATKLALPDSGPLVNPPPPPATRPALQSAPAITGTAKAGGKLSCSEGTWSNSPTGFTYQWSRQGTPIAGATTGGYTVQTDDEGLRLTCTVTAANAAGSGPPATSSGVTVTVPVVKRCPRATGTLGGVKLGLLRLGMTRAQARNAYKKSSNRGKKYQDFFCLTPRGIRVGYASPALLKTLPRGERKRLADRVIWASTAYAFYSLDGVRPGATVLAAGKLLKLSGPFHIGLNVWYLAPNGSSTGVLKVRAGIVDEIGIGDKSLTKGHQAQKIFLTSFS